MTKRQYIFLFLLTILLYLSFTIIKHEYRGSTISTYKEEQRAIISELQLYIESAHRTVEYKLSQAYKNKVLKSQQ